jgi:hypothetical protein
MIDVSFIVLCPDRRVGGLKNTLGSIQYHTYARRSLCVVGEDVFADELIDMKKLAPTFVGANTITSLINKGMKECHSDWGFIVFSGSRVCPYIEKRFESLAKKESDILFPTVDRKCDFVSGSFNGVLMNKNFFNKVGDFPSHKMEKAGLNDFEFSKLLWAIDAITNGVTFKAVVGMKII